MHLLHAKRGFPIHMDGTVLHAKQGWKYIIPDHLAANFQSVPEDAATLKPFINEKELTGKIDFTGKRLLVNRTGGIGDFFFICRSIYEIKKQYKNVFVEFACAPRYAPAITELLMPHVVDKSNTILIPYSSYEMCDYFFTFEGFIEDTAHAMRVNAFELVAAHKFYIDIGLDHTVPITISKLAAERARRIVEGITSPIIGIQLKATAILRTYPTTLLLELMQMLFDKGYAILLLDKQPNIEEFMNVWLRTRPHLKDKFILPYAKDIPGSIDLSAALIKHCSLVIAPDSSLVYIADSLNVPVIGLYGPVASYLRAKGLNVYAVEARGGCYNCYRHGVLECPWTIDGWSCCLKRLRPDLIAQLASDIIMKVK